MINPKSIAVLPFENMSSDPENEYFSDGMTEEIINALTRIEELKVSARTSSFAFKNKSVDIRTIAKELGVSLILEGSIRKSKDRLRITAQLIRAEDGFHVWSENFDRNLIDIFELQDEISLLIADKIREHFGHLSIQEHLVKINTKNVKAYELYLKGKAFFNKWTLPGFDQAMITFQESIEEDPSFDLPYFGAGLSYSLSGAWCGVERKKAITKAEAYFEKGFALNQDSIYQHFNFAQHQFWGLWNANQAHRSLLKAYDIIPHDSEMNEFMAEIQMFFGNFSLAMKYMETSLQLDPLSPNHYYSKANIYFLQERFEEALATIEKGLKVQPDFLILQEFKVICLVIIKRKSAFELAINDFGLELQGVFKKFYGLHEVTIAETELTDAMKTLKKHGSHLLLPWDLYLLALADSETSTLLLLREKVDMKLGQVINFKYDPFLKHLSGTDAFQKLVSDNYVRADLKSSLKRPSKSKQHLEEAEATTYSKKLEQLMEEGKTYLNSELSLKSLAEDIDLHPNKLSWLLNEKLGKNFYDYINSYRLKDFQERALAKENQHISLLGLALDSGFNSKSVFNEYFKRTTGFTPKAWINHQRNL